MPMASDSATEDAESVYEAAQRQPFQPLASEPVQPKPSPTDLPNSGSGGGTSGEDGTASGEVPAAAQAEQPEQPSMEFDPKYKESFKGLMYLGRITKDFSLWGHSFSVKTLTTEEHTLIGLLCAQYEGTRAANAVYQTAVVAASVVLVDGQELPQPLGPDQVAALRVRFDYVSREWMPPVREKIFEEAFSLEMQVREVLEEMGKASG